MRPPCCFGILVCEGMEHKLANPLVMMTSIEVRKTFEGFDETFEGMKRAT